jgi:DNA-binding response OmpR family regulator
MRRVLVVSDDPASFAPLQQVLESAGIAVSLIREQDAAVPPRGPVDCVLLDLRDSPLPALQKVRRHSPSAAVIVATALESEGEPADALQGGADDFVVRPLRPRELVSRVVEQTRRSAAPAGGIKIGPLTVDAAAQTVRLGDEPIETTATEFRIMDLLARNAGQVVSREQVLETCRRSPHPARMRSVDVHIRSLRKKLKDGGDLILTVREAGYRLKTADELG